MLHTDGQTQQQVLYPQTDVYEEYVVDCWSRSLISGSERADWGRLICMGDPRDPRDEEPRLEGLYLSIARHAATGARR